LSLLLGFGIRAASTIPPRNEEGGGPSSIRIASSIARGEQRMQLARKIVAARGLP